MHAGLHLCFSHITILVFINLACLKIYATSFDLDMRKPVLRGLRSTNVQMHKRANRTAHPGSLISSYILCFLERIISSLAMSQISIF